jgi:diketogulonate reductase-like aldo/keto reductase
MELSATDMISLNRNDIFFGKQSDDLPKEKNLISLKRNDIFFGTYKLTDEIELIKALHNAFVSGIRHFDFAELYKNQHIIGKFFQENNIPREQIWITSKVSFRSIPKGEISIRNSINKTFSDLKTDYIDLMLIHAPTKNNILCWNILNEYKKAGKIRYIGISNFNVSCLTEFINSIPNPQDIFCNQIEFNPFLNRSELINLCKENNIKLSCYGTLYKSNDFIDSLQQKYKKTTKQILIQFAIQKGFNPIIMTTERKYIEEDCNLNFEIEKDDFDKMDMFDENYSMYKRYL